MNKLIEGVLSVGTRLAPRYRSRRVGDTTPRARYILAVRLHVALLEVRRKPVHVLSHAHTFCTVHGSQLDR